MVRIISAYEREEIGLRSELICFRGKAMRDERMRAHPQRVQLAGAGTRVTQVALFVNAALHGAASAGMALGLGPHAADQPNMARRAAAAGLAGAFMLAVVALRLRRDPYLVLVPLVFVACNLA